VNKALLGRVEAALGVSVKHAERVSGGDINDAYALTCSTGEMLFVKTKANAPATMYPREAEGLSFLRQASALRVPEVRFVSEELLVLEWIDARGKSAKFDEDLGRGLARLHRFGAPSYGLDKPNFVGSIPQDNTPESTWCEFYRVRRLEPLIARAGSTLSASVRRDFDTLFARLPELVVEEPPARLHGDLWTGNVHSDESGTPVLIDPAVYGGSREIDLAMLMLFGAPSNRLFAAYEEVFPLADGWRERTALYQIYPLLVHVCLFGASYVSQLTRALKKYL
jgi:fructosamine-3-kinase